MMTKPKEPAATASPLAAIWVGMRKIIIDVRRGGERVALANERLAALEERVAALDGGDGRDAASRSALLAANATAVREARAPLNLILRTDGRLEFVGVLSDQERESNDRS